MAEKIYDFIVVGAGSAGCIVTARILKARPDASVLLLEAGDDRPLRDSRYSDPALWTVVQSDAGIQWGYNSEPQPHLNNRVIKQSKARALGGCSAYNPMVYVHGSAYEYNAWEASGCTGWGYKSITRHFQRLEQELYITHSKRDPFVSAFLKAADQSGLPFNDGYNGKASHFGSVLLDFTIDQNGKRENLYQTHVQPWLDARANIEVISNALVGKVLLDQQKQATGIEYIDTQSGQTLRARVRQEIILSAGAVGNPQILMLSGIGASAELAKFNIPVVVDLKGVGQNVQDHVVLTTVFTAKKAVPPQPYGVSAAAAFVSLDGDPQHDPLPLVDLEFLTTSQTFDANALSQTTFLIYPVVMGLKSRGTITLRSSNPRDLPRLDPNYLSAPGDVEKCLKALKLSRKVGHAAGLDDWRDAELLPGSHIQTDEQLVEFIQNNAFSAYHIAGSCKMGVDAQAVVDPELKVRGVSGLSVIDASIMPQIVSGNTVAATMMIAEKGAEILLQRASGVMKSGRA